LSHAPQQYGAEHAIFNLLKKRHGFDASRHLSSVTAPVRILWPSKAVGFRPGEAVNLCRDIARSSMEILPEASAFAPMETPAEIG
jgi:hypothetical protein